MATRKKPTRTKKKQPAAEIETRSGVMVDLDAPDPATILFYDIAWGLAHTPRFAGQAFRFYSVAEHAVLVAQILTARGESPQVALRGLHHDDPEAYIGDIPTGMKRVLGQPFEDLYESIEGAIHESIFVEQHGFRELRGASVEKAVKEADLFALAYEAAALMPSEGLDWSEDLPNPDEDLNVAEGMEWPERMRDSLGLQPQYAYDLWTEMHYGLVAKSLRED